MKSGMKKCHLALLLLLLLFCGSVKAYAAEAAIAFGEDAYSVEEDTFEIEVLINAEEAIGVYEISLVYDTERMEYVSGAERESGGIITLEGTGFGNEVAYILEFRAIGAGDAGLAVQDARVYSAGDEAVSYTVSALPTVPVDIQGEDSGGIAFFDRLQRERQEEPGDGQGFETDIPILGNIAGGDGKLLYIVDLADYEPPVALWDYKLVTGTYGDEDFTYISDQGRTVRVVLMIDEDGRFHPYAYAEADGSFYPVDEIVSEGETCYIISPRACLNVPEEIPKEELDAGTVFYAIHKDGAGGYCRYTSDGILEEWRQEPADLQGTEPEEGADVIFYLLCAALAVSAAGALTAEVLIFRRKSGGSTLRDGVKKVKSYFDDRKKYIFVLTELTGREVKRKYARSHLGIVWSVLNPLLMMIVMSMVFSYMFKRSIDNFPLYYLTGSLFWNLFSEGTNHAMSALVDNKSLLIKAKLPRQTFVASRMLTALVNLGYSCIPYALMLVVFGVRPSWTMLLLPLDIIFMFAFTMGIGYILSILYVFFADIKYLYSVFLRILLYFTALFYPVTALPEVLQRIIGYNPVYLSIYIARECMVYGNIPHYSAWVKLTLSALVSCALGWIIFRKKQNDVMQRI